MVLLAVGKVSAHDFWIEPSSYEVKLGARVALRLRVGESFQGTRVVRSGEHISRFISAGLGGETAIDGVEGIDPAGFFQPAEPGFHVVGYFSNPTFIELQAAKFEEYLREEGLDQIVELRRERGDSSNPGRELFSRCAKTLIRAGDSDAPSGFDRSLGFPLEIVPLTNPYAAGSAQSLSVRLSYRGAPVEGGLVVATHRVGESSALQVRTDAEGGAVLELGRAGIWLINAVHMVPAGAGSGADWHSWWASLTFRIPAE